jgi:glycine C-acetyltransferase
MADLEKQLQAADAAGARTKLITTDGTFSMDGFIAPLDQITALAEKYDAMVHIDECHCTGFLGETGRGAAEVHGVMNKIDIFTGTLGKALGGAVGGFTTGRKEVIELLRQRSRPYLFSNSLPPHVVAAGHPIVPVMIHDAKKAQAMASGLLEEGIYVTGFFYPVVPKGQARIRTQMSAAHTRAQLDQAIAAFIKVGRKLGVLDN